MENIEQIQQLLASSKELKEQNITFAEFISTIFKDKYLEIYVGDSYEDVSTEQISTSYPAVFCGKVIGAYRECLIINGFHVTKNKQVSFGNILFVNERAIRTLCEINGSCSIQDTILRSIDVNPIYHAHKNKLQVKIKK